MVIKEEYKNVYLILYNSDILKFVDNRVKEGLNGVIEKEKQKLEEMNERKKEEEEKGEQEDKEDKKSQNNNYLNEISLSFEGFRNILKSFFSKYPQCDLRLVDYFVVFVFDFI
jgi:negative regulator of genetic competence, sporulation and motility